MGFTQCRSSVAKYVVVSTAVLGNIYCQEATIDVSTSSSRPVVAGTGTLLTTENKDLKAHLYNRLQLVIKEQVVPSIDVRTPSQYIELVRKVLNPAISELSQAMGVTRQAFYKWASGDSHPEQIHLDKLRKLNIVAEKVSSSGLRNTSSVLRLKLNSGKSILDLIKENKDIDSALNTIITESLAAECKYNNSKILETKSANSESWRSSESISMYQDESIG